MINKQTLLAFLGALCLTLLGGGATWYWLSRQPVAGVTAAAAATAARSPEHVEYKDSRFVSLDKVIVMLRDEGGGPVSHYMSVDLVFRTTEENEKKVKEHLPYLRSVAVNALSSYTLAKAGQTSVGQFQQLFNAAYAQSYVRDQLERPFADVMIGRLIIE